MKELDERVSRTKQSINSRAFGYAFIALWAIISYRMFILRQTPSEYADIILLTIGLSSFVVISTVRQGVFVSSKRKEKNKVLSRILEIVYLIAFIFAFRFITGIESIPKLAYASSIMVIIRFSPMLFNKLSNWIIDRKLEND